MEYRHEQTTAILRRMNVIKAYRILDIQGNNLIVGNKDKTAEFPVSEPDDYKIGGYVDMIFTRTGSSGQRIELVGHTPAQFVPSDGRNVAG